MSITSDQKSQIIDLIRRKYPEWDSFEHRPFMRDEINTRRLTVKKATALLSESTLAHMLVTRETEAFIDRLERLGKATNLLDRPDTEHGDLEILYVPTLDKPVFCAQIYHLLHGTESAQERLGAYLRYVGDHELPNSWTFPTYLLFFSNPRTDFFVEPQPTEWFLKYIGLSPYLGKPSPETYVAVKEFAHGLKHALAEFRPLDMIDIQSLIRVCAAMSQPASRPAPLVAASEPPIPEPVVFWADQNPDDADATVLHPSNPLAQQQPARPIEPKPTIANGSRPATPLDQHYRTFLETFMTSPGGIAMAAAFARAREQAEQHFAHIVAEHELGEIVTERVFLHLLPHADRREHVASGAWIHPMPAMDDALNSLAHLASSEREQAATALLELTRQCVYNPRAIGTSIERFKLQAQAAPFQSRHVSPMLQTLKPGAFLLASDDTVSTINFFSGTGFSNHIEHYPDVNEAGMALVRYLHSGAHAFGFKSIQNTDLFAIFCSWFIAQHGQRKPVAARKPIDLPTVDAPLSGDGGPTKQQPAVDPLTRNRVPDLPEAPPSQPVAESFDYIESPVEHPGPEAQAEPEASLKAEPTEVAEFIVEIESLDEDDLPEAAGPFAEAESTAGTEIRAAAELPSETETFVDTEWTAEAEPVARVELTSEAELLVEGEPTSQEEMPVEDELTPKAEPFVDAELTGIAEPAVIPIEPAEANWTDDLIAEAEEIDEHAPPPLTESDAEALAEEARAIDRLLEENATGYDSGYDSDYEPDFHPEFDRIVDSGIDDIPEVLRSLDATTGSNESVAADVDDFVSGADAGVHVQAEADSTPIYLPHTYLPDTDEPDTVEPEIDDLAAEEPVMEIIKTEHYELALPVTDPDPLSECAALTGFGPGELRRWIETIRRKKQVIISGPPGAGKTFLARHLARVLAGSGDGFVETVQFHPSYGYEDFVGPLTGMHHDENHPALGRFSLFCERAVRHSGDCVMVIDEINRADLSRVLGELVYLLEYREDAISLAAGHTLRVPNNAYIIATMSASAGPTIDPIVRRRFAFIELPPRLDVLKRYLERAGYPAGPLVALLDRLNAEIADPNGKLGIAYFMREDLAENLEAIWRLEVEPALEASFYGRPEKLAAYRWEQIGAEL